MSASNITTSPAPVPPTGLPVIPARKAPKWLRPLLLTVVGLGVLAWLGHFAFLAYHYEETDNAYVVGHLHQISPLIDGQVREVLVADNQTVRAGDPLLRLDPLEFEIAREKAVASLAQGRAQQTQAEAAAHQSGAQIVEAQARVAQAEAQLKQTATQFALAQLTLNRQEELFTHDGASTKADLDNARSAFQGTQAAQAASDANLTAARAGVGSAEAAQASAQAQAVAARASVTVLAASLHDTERKLSYTTLVAPADGRIGNKSVETGNYVLAGQLLLALAEPDVWIVANYKETQLPRMRVGQDVEITVDALPGRTLHGKVDSFSPASGAEFALLPPDNATGNFNKVVQRIPVKITLTPADQQDLNRKLLLGFSVVARVRVR
ncbi:MAG: HlyD family secretion protein [Opitutaceae bacterium]